MEHLIVRIQCKVSSKKPSTTTTNIPGQINVWYMKSIKHKYIYTERSKAVLLLLISCVFLCLVFLMRSCLFTAAFWSPAGKGLNSWLLLLILIVFLLLSHVVS